MTDYRKPEDFFLLFMYFIQYCFICRPSDAGIEPSQTIEGTHKMVDKEFVYIQNYTYLRLHIKSN